MNLRLIAFSFFIIILSSCSKEDVTTLHEDLKVSLDQEIATESEKTIQKSQVFDVAFTNWILNRQQPSGLLESTEISRLYFLV
ncbi:hypothetical protein NYZ99_02305 [Maribacter litopenaei]|uniref:Uncharacterized protein n=1 Tax=Maribacter litopenaei TaxID=2976127 RepID=A0ABY5Y8Q9_9FLAO|nr:hypothetical protein [Maribacter litopenaei]UWX55408.1 hypothetical protein NYZ99_02305 [Maribacter litopenaei]